MKEACGSEVNTCNNKEHPDLYRRSIKGGYWIIFLRLVTNLLSFGKVLIIANFFYLEDLGIISIALMLMDIMSTFTETGFNVALIQKKENIHSYLDTAWTAGLVKGIVLFLILYCAAPFLASIRVSEDKIDLTISVLRVMGVCFLIIGIRNIGVIYFQKELDFKKEFALNFLFSLADIVLSVILVFVFRSIWGIIIARLVAVAVSSVGSFILSSYRPRFYFEYAKARELWRFGKWIYGINIIGYLTSQGDKYLIWSCLGLPQLALYKYAYDFATMPYRHIAGVISSVSFPAYSKIQSDIPRLREAYLKVLKVAALFFVPASFLVFLLGPDFVRLFLPERMYPMIFTLQLLVFRGFAASFNGTIDTLYRSIGKPKISWLLMVYFLPILAILIYPMTKMWGIAGTAVATLIPGVCIIPVNILILRRILSCSPRPVFRTMLLPIAASAGMTGLIYLFKTLISIYPEYVTFLLAPDAAFMDNYPVILLNVLILLRPEYVSFACYGVLGISVYGLAVWMLDGIFKQGIREMIMEQVGSLKQRFGYKRSDSLN